MKKVISIIISISFAVIALGQEQNFGQTDPKPVRRGYIGFSLGAAIPTGDFASTDINSDNSGFAQTGLTIQLVNFGYTFGGNFGIAGMWSGAAFALDVESLAKNAGLSGMTVESDLWSFGAFMGGLLVSLPSNSMNVDFRFMIGSGSGTAPEMSISGFVNGSHVDIIQNSASAMSLAYDLGIGLRLNVSKLISLNLFMDYLGCKATFVTDIYAGSLFLETVEFVQPMNQLNITGGIGFRLP